MRDTQTRDSSANNYFSVRNIASKQKRLLVAAPCNLALVIGTQCYQC